MSLMFSCGEFGCHIEEIDDIIMKETMNKCEEWARRQRLKRGEYPSMDEQVDYVTYLYARLTQIKIA